MSDGITELLQGMVSHRGLQRWEAEMLQRKGRGVLDRINKIKRIGEGREAV